MSMERRCFSSVVRHCSSLQKQFVEEFLYVSPNSTRKAFINLTRRPSEEDKMWPHGYGFRLRVALGPGGELLLTSRIRNTNSGEKLFSFTFAYHTCFSVSDIRERFTEQGDAITFEAEMDKWSGIHGIRRQKLWLISEMMNTSMCCVDAAAIEKPVTLKSGDEWRGKQELSIVGSSYCSGQIRNGFESLLLSSCIGC